MMIYVISRVKMADNRRNMRLLYLGQMCAIGEKWSTDERRSDSFVSGSMTIRNN